MQSDGPRSRFIPNTVALVAQTVLATLITLIQVKLLTSFLSKDDLGRFASLRGLSLLISMLAANGLPQLLIRFVPVHEARGASRRAMVLSIACFVATSVLLTLLCAVAWSARHSLFGYLGAGGVSLDLMKWFVLTTAAVGLKQVLYGGLGGLRRLTTQVVIELLSLGGVLAWIVVAREALSLTLLFRILGTVHGLSVLCGVPVYLWMLARLRSGGGESSPTGYGGYLLWATGISFVALAFTDVDRYVLAQVLTLELLALFHIGARVARLGHRLLGVANLAFQPEVTRIAAEGRRHEVEDATRLFLKFNVTIAVFIAAWLALFSREIIVLVASPDYAGAVPLMIILVMTLPISTMTAPITTVMKALDQVRAALVVDLVWALIYIGLIFTIGPVLGLVGVGLATAGAALAQLVVAVGTSRLAIGGRTLIVITGKLAAAALVLWWPVYAVGRWVSGPELNIVLKIVLFLAGAAVYPRLLKCMHVFEVPERDRLVDIFRMRGLGGLARFV